MARPFQNDHDEMARRGRGDKDKDPSKGCPSYRQGGRMQYEMDNAECKMNDGESVGTTKETISEI
jgi:hypothetical protein